MKYNVHYYVTKDGETYDVRAEIEFSCDPEQYGNGYSMFIKSTEEAFGGQGYDIRYDKRFDPERPMMYIVEYFHDRYDGKGERWKLIGIRVFEGDEL